MRNENYSQNTRFYRPVPSFPRSRRWIVSSCDADTYRVGVGFPVGVCLLGDMGVDVAAGLNKILDPISIVSGVCSYKATYSYDEKTGETKLTSLWINPDLPYGHRKMLEGELLK